MKIRLLIIAFFYLFSAHSLFAQPEDCYVHIEDVVGMYTTSYKNLLEAEACELRSTFPAEFQDQFSTNTFGFYYHANTFNDEHTGYSSIFENYRTGRINTPFYLLIGKKSSPLGIHERFEVHVELPQIGAFSDLDDILLSAIQNGIVEAMTTTYQEKGGRPENYVDAEIAGMRALRRYVEQIVDGTFGFSEDILLLDGFELIADDGLDVRRSGPQNPGYPVFDYAGIEHKYGGGYGFINTAASDGVEALLNSKGITSSIIITDNENYHQTTQFDLAKDEFENSIDQVVVWLHVYGTGTDAKLYAKFGNNFTQGDAAAFINESYEEFKGEEIPDDYNPIALRDTSTNNTSLRNSPSCNGCFENSCSIDLEWRAINCIVPCAGEFDCTGGFAIAEFGVGVVSGALDGVLGDVLFLVSLGKSAGQAINEFAKHTLLTPQWFRDLLESVAKAESWREGFLSKFSSDIEYQKELWEEIYDGVVAVYETLVDLDSESLKRVYNGIKNVIQSYFQNIVGNNGTVMQGYSVGSSVYFIVTTFLTGGAGGARGGLRKITDLTEEGLNKIKSLKSVDDFKDIMNEAINWAKSGVDNSVQALLHIRCKILVDGCFGEGTLVSSEKSLKAIEKLNIGDRVVVNLNMDHYDYQNGFDESAKLNIDPYVSESQKKVDQTSLDYECWYSIELKLENINGTESKVQLLRPQWWLDDHALFKEQDKTWLSMPEMGLEGLATLTSLSRFRTTKKMDQEDENNRDTYGVSLISGIFE